MITFSLFISSLSSFVFFPFRSGYVVYFLRLSGDIFTQWLRILRYDGLSRATHSILGRI